jgi:phosphate transport system protein
LERLDAYARRDPDAALAVWRGDQAIDAANKALMRDILSAMTEDPRNIPFGAQLLFCVKNLERMGDHVTNIAETIYYIVKGVVLDEARPKG